MRDLRAAAFAAAMLFALAGCQQSTVDVAEVEAKAKQDVRDWMAAFNAGDIDTIVDLYAPDAVLMAPGNPAASGHEAIRAVVAKESAAMKAAGITLAASEDDTAGVSGDLLWHSGSFTANDATGAAVDSGNYLEVQQNFDGKWLIIRDIWNSDRPPPEPAAEPAAETEAEAPAG